MRHEKALHTVGDTRELLVGQAQVLGKLQVVLTRGVEHV
jgi:hypothetical protein